jgi:predicted transcriptional regulator
MRLSGEIDVTYSTILHHLHNLESRGIIERASSKPPFEWKVNPVGQQRLMQ